MNKKLLALSAAMLMILSSCANSTNPPSESPNNSPAETTSQAASETETTEADTTKAVTETTTSAAAPEYTTQEGAPDIDGYTLLWNDEFEGDSLDESVWNREVRQPGWTNEELQEYTSKPDNAFLRDGNLVLKAIKTDDNGKPYYTSGKLNSHNTRDFTYGKITARAKVPEGQGLWPAIWMMPQ
ncbi:MAG: glycoside hydrolase family 16 protein, partial [Ruminococcus sp.]|nr:glycoside hydrolase family 16 protein [Ruminococcus sp.]